MTFEAWLQSRLVAHGHRIAVDGVIGPQTRRALDDFQWKRRLTQSGVADSQTVLALRADPAQISGKDVSDPPLETMPPWMAEMYRRMGLHESRDNSSLIAWLRAGKFLGNPAKLPWCGDAVETCIVKTIDEPVPNNPFWAQAWKDFGRDAGGPKVGSVGVIRWNARSGHVGFVANYSASRILLLGGNQSDAINLTWFARSKFIAFRWPNSFPMKTYAPLSADGKAGSLAGTR